MPWSSYAVAPVLHALPTQNQASLVTHKRHGSHNHTPRKLIEEEIAKKQRATRQALASTLASTLTSLPTTAAPATRRKPAPPHTDAASTGNLLPVHSLDELQPPLYPTLRHAQSRATVGVQRSRAGSTSSGPSDDGGALHMWQTRVFPSNKPVGRQQALYLAQALRCMLAEAHAAADSDAVAAAMSADLGVLTRMGACLFAAVCRALYGVVSLTCPPSPFVLLLSLQPRRVTPTLPCKHCMESPSHGASWWRLHRPRPSSRK